MRCVAGVEFIWFRGGGVRVGEHGFGGGEAHGDDAGGEGEFDGACVEEGFCGGAVAFYAGTGGLREGEQRGVGQSGGQAVGLDDEAEGVSQGQRLVVVGLVLGPWHLVLLTCGYQPALAKVEQRSEDPDSAVFD